MYKKGNKIIASLVVFMMLITNMSTLGIQIGGVIAASSELNEQNNKTNNANVEFDVYFGQQENKAHEAITKIGEENKIVADISVKNSGYLKNAMVEFADANFKVKNTTNSQEKVLGVENNKLYLNQIDAGEDIKFEIPIEFEHSMQVNTSKFDKINNIKLTGTYVNENGKERKIEKEIKLGVKWTANIQSTTTGEITKYVPFNVNGQKGLIMQMLVKSFVNENMLPIKENVIEISVPKINNINPRNINVYSKNSNIEFGKDNYNYDENTNKLTIDIQNNINSENQIYWLNAQEGGYIVTYIYPEQVLEGMNEEGTNVNIDINSNIKVYSCNEQVLTSNYKNEVVLKDKIGEIADLRITTTENLSKAYMYANIKATEKIETIYNQKVNANIDLPDLIDEITISMGADKFDKGTDVINTYYKNIKITKTEFNKFFGEEGFIKIYSGENLIGTIDKNTQDEQITLELNTETITIKTSKPIIAGELTFECEKAVKPEISYTKEQLQSFENMNLEANIQIVNNETVIVNKDVQGQTNLIEPTHQAEIQISDTNLSTVVTNENIEIRAILKTDSLNNKLYENPKIIIDLPEYIENVNVKNVQLLFDDELTIISANLVQSQNGNKQIVIELSGEQTKYSIGSSYKGANIVITADITANNLTPNKESELKMTVITGNEQIETIQKVNFIAPTGIVTVNKISNFSEGKNLMALTNDEQSTLEVATNAKNAIAEIQVINNYNNIINNIQILGRTLTSGTTDTETNQDLKNTFDAPMVSGINTNGLENVTIYYSEKGNATADLQNTENGWNTEITDFSKVKSYLIVLNNYTMNVGDMIKFTYNAQIPENLGYSQVVNSLYTVYFDNVQEEQTIKDKAKSRKVTLETGVAPSLEVALNSYSKENSTVRAGQYVKFIATVKNTGTSDIENVKLNITAPRDTLYFYENEEGEILLTRDTSLIEHKDNPVQDIAISYLTKHTEFVQEDFYTGYRDSEETEKTIQVGTVKAGETKEIEYELKIDDVLISRENLDLEDDAELPEVILNSKVRAIAEDMQEEVASNEYKLKLAEGDISIIVGADKTPDNILNKKDELTYSARLIQINRYGSIKNVVVTVKVPDELMIKSANVENFTFAEGEKIEAKVDINRANNIVKFTIDEFYLGAEIGCNILTQVVDETGEITPEITATVNGENKHYGNIIKNKISKLDFEITQNNLDNPYVKENEDITFEYKITNTSDVYCSDFTFENKVPDGMKVIKVETIIGNETTNLKDYTEDVLTINRTFKAGQTIIIRVTMRAKLMEEGETSKEIENYAKIYGPGFEEKQSNIVKATIEYNEEAHKYNKPDPEDPENPSNPNSNKVISGIAWVDSNKDGERNNGEQLISGMEVRLLKKSTNEVVKQTQTSSTGEYIFTQVEEGDYLVVFIYNSYKYDLTEYKKAGISQSTNSDVINVTMDIDGKETTVAISDTIKISNSNVRNIDIGLCESEKSDLRLDKYISSITLTYGNTVKTYNYKDAKLAKVEIPAKNLSNATVIVEYKIVVTNEGAIGNYVKKIVDYIPKDMKFNSELNRDWYESTNGDIYNSSLANTKLESGESKEVTLTLTKKMTDSNVGIVNNNAELYEVYNEEGIQDIDSTPANRVNGEDDMSAADVVISVKTGDAILYTVVISTLICITIGVSIYYIRKKVLRKI